MSYPLIMAAHSSGMQSDINRIVIHCTVSPCAPGWARKIANYFHGAGSGGSAHYVVDPGEIIQCLPEKVIAWHAPPNTGSIGIELCDWQKGKASRWSDDDHENMLRRAAPLVGAIAKRYGIPLVWLTPADLRNGKRGICGHVDVSNAWHQSDHGDPEMAGPFPRKHFLDLIKGHSEDDMPTAKELWNHEIDVPFGTKENPQHQADSLLVDANVRIRNLERDIVQIKEMLSTLLGKG